MTMTTALTLFELFRQFDSLNHKAILETLCKMDPEGFQAAVQGTANSTGTHQWMKEKIYIVRRGGDNLIAGVFHNEADAKNKMYERNAEFPSSNYYMTNHSVR